MSLITAENSKPGSHDWQLTRMRLDKNEGFRSSVIEGYCSRQSLKAGESLDIFVSTKPAARFKIEIFRTGYYGGRGARKMMELGPLQGVTQSTPKPGTKNLHECRWTPATTLKIPADWPSGTAFSAAITCGTTLLPISRIWSFFAVPPTSST